MKCLCSSFVYVSCGAFPTLQWRSGHDIVCFSQFTVEWADTDTYTAYRHICTPVCLRAPDCVGYEPPGRTFIMRDVRLCWLRGSAPTVVCRSPTCSWWGLVLWRTLQIWGPKLDTIICICVEPWESTVDTIIRQEPHRHVCSIACTCMASCVIVHVSVHVRVELLSICNIMRLCKGQWRTGVIWQVACVHWQGTVGSSPQI